MLSGARSLGENLLKALLGERLLGRQLGNLLHTFLKELGWYQFGRVQERVTASASLDATDNGKTFIVNGTGAVTLTLPVATELVGPYHFFNVVAQDLVIAAPSSNDTLVVGGDAAADTVTFSTAEIGACGTIMAVDVSQNATPSYKWAVIPLAANAATIA